MNYEIEHGPSFARVELTLEPGEEMSAEAGALLSHTPGVEIETGASGGLMKSLRRSVLGGESFFVNTYRATQRANVSLAPALPGDIIAHELTDETVYVQSSSYLAGDPTLDVDTEFGGARSFFGGEGLFLLRMEGTGQSFLSSYGAIDEHALESGESLVVDTGHIVAFEGTVDYDVRSIGGLKSTFLSGEGLVCEFEGPGTVWTQTRSPDAFLAWLAPQLPSNQSN